MDVEQIMREIRAKISQRHGVELTDQQVQELAARRLESILDLRSIKPGFLDQLRRSAGARPDTVAAADRATAPYEFEDTTLYDSPSGFTRFIRKLLNPILKLLFNPNPLIRALHLQSRLNTDLAKREAERDLRQAEWNALHFEILQRVVSEASRATLELQNLSLRVESLAAKVDFNERRVRGIEGVVHQPRPGAAREREGREREREGRERDVPPVPAPQASPAEVTQSPRETTAPETAGTGEAPRRRRRRRRGRRGGATPEAAAGGTAVPAAAVDTMEGDDLDEGGPDEIEPGEPPVREGEASVVAPERVTPQLETIDPSAREDAAPELPVPAPTLSEPEPHEPQ